MVIDMISRIQMMLTLTMLASPALAQTPPSYVVNPGAAMTGDGQNLLVQNGSKSAYAIYAPNGSTYKDWGNIRSVVTIPSGTNIQNVNGFDAWILDKQVWDASSGLGAAGVGAELLCRAAVAGAGCFGINPAVFDSTDGTPANSFAAVILGGETDIDTENSGTRATGMSYQLQGAAQPLGANVIEANVTSGSTAHWTNGFALFDGALMAGGAGMILGTEGASSGANIASAPIVFNEFDGSAVEHHIYLQAYPNATVSLSDTVYPNGIAFELATSGNAPQITVTGSDANVDLGLTPKGTGKVLIGGSSTIQSGNFTFTGSDDYQLYGAASDIFRIIGGGSAGGMILYGSSRTGQDGSIHFRNNSVDDHEGFSVDAGTGVIVDAGVTSVSCSVGQANASTMVVTNGIVTHC